jgi:hypothetical protein
MWISWDYRRISGIDVFDSLDSKQIGADTANDAGELA